MSPAFCSINAVLLTVVFVYPFMMTGVFVSSLSSGMLRKFVDLHYRLIIFMTLEH